MEADEKFAAPTSAYKSAWIVREYKKRGGEFEGKPSPKEGLKRWFKEKWEDVSRPGEPCGRPSASPSASPYPLCRPTVRVSRDTPKLKSEIGAKKLEKANKEKQKIKEKGRVKLG